MDYRDKQMIRLAIWSIGIISSAGHDLLVQHGTKMADQDYMVILGGVQEEIKRQFRYNGECIALDAMIGRCELCDHPIKYQFMLENTKSSHPTHIVGSECIVNYVDASFKKSIGDERRKADHKRRAGEHRRLVDRALAVVGPDSRVRDFVEAMDMNAKKYGTLTPAMVKGVKNILESQVRRDEVPYNGYPNHTS